jgi:hypothetical protein
MSSEMMTVNIDCKLAWKMCTDSHNSGQLLLVNAAKFRLVKKTSRVCVFVLDLVHALRNFFIPFYSHGFFVC